MKNTVKLNREFTYAYKKGAKIVTGTLVFYWYKNRQSQSRLGLTVSTALGGSVVRNRLKRLMRAAYSARKDDVKPGYNIIVAARAKMARVKFAEIEKDMQYCLEKAGLI
ncbi:MAG: ribonuclease P protein component [Ruminococcaceae bacterium]|nr:ribonuclease P protein component [Oscillospiraceae bacterium]